MSQRRPEQFVGDSARTTSDGSWDKESVEPSAPRHTNDVRSAGARRRGVLAAVLAGLLVLGVGLAVIETLPTRYSTTSTVSFAPRSQPNISADVIELAANKYAVVAGSTTSVTSAAAAASVTRKELRDALSISVDPQTANLNISVALGNSREAAAAANTIADVVNRAGARDRLISGEITARADPDAAQLQPSRTLLRVVAVAAALLVAGWVSFAVRQVSRRQGASGERS